MACLRFFESTVLFFYWIGWVFLYNSMTTLHFWRKGTSAKVDIRSLSRLLGNNEITMATQKKKQQQQQYNHAVGWARMTSSWISLLCVLRCWGYLCRSVTWWTRLCSCCCCRCWFGVGYWERSSNTTLIIKMGIACGPSLSSLWGVTQCCPSTSLVPSSCLVTVAPSCWLIS